MRGKILNQRPDIVKNIMTRSKVISAVRAFLDENGLLEVETPILCTHREGGPFLQFETENPVNGKKYFLSMCPEDRLKRICWLFENGVYEFSRCFRQEDDPQHLTEFTMLEIKQPHKEFNDQINLSYELIKHVADKCMGSLKFRDVDLSSYDLVTCEAAMKNAIGVELFKHDSHERLLRFLESAKICVREKSNKCEVMDLAMKFFVEPTLQNLTFLVDFPLELSTISRVYPGSNVAKRFNIILKGIEIGDGGEKIIGSEGYVHLYNQNAIYRQNNLGIRDHNEPCLDFFLDMEFAPPISGFGIGIDRLVSLMLGCDIDDILLFPKSFDR